MKRFRYQMVASHPKGFSLTYIFYLWNSYAILVRVSQVLLRQQTCRSQRFITQFHYSLIEVSLLCLVATFQQWSDLSCFRHTIMLSEFFVSSHSGRREKSMRGARVPFLLPQMADSMHRFTHTQSHEPKSVTWPPHKFKGSWEIWESLWGNIGGALVFMTHVPWVLLFVLFCPTQAGIQKWSKVHSENLPGSTN